MPPETIIMADYSPAWPAAFAHEAALIGAILHDNALQIFHIGSTAVPGLSAKPIIDILPVVRDLGLLDAQAAQFAALGYEVMGEYGIPGRRFFRKGAPQRTHHIHAFAYDSALDILRHLAFRDYLRQHPAVCAEYQAIKGELAQRCTDMEQYCAGKDAFVKQTERAALQWYWQTVGREEDS